MPVQVLPASSPPRAGAEVDQMVLGTAYNLARAIWGPGGTLNKPFRAVPMPQGGRRRSSYSLGPRPSEVPMCAVPVGPVKFGWDRPLGMPVSAPQLPFPESKTFVVLHAH